jgi:iron complex transport system ATP-binding protein
VKDLELEAPPGDLVAVVGPNGSGKSTLLRVLAGLQAPLDGHVSFEGLDIHHLDPAARARLVGIGLSHHETPPHLRVRELVSLGRYPYTSWFGGLSETDRRTVDEALTTTGISALADREVATLSDGEAQKAHIARGVAQEAPLLVLDEPTAYLDVTSRFEITHMLRELAHREGRLVVFSTHDLAIARETADRMWLFMPAERLVQGAPEDLALGGMIREAFSRRGVSFSEDGSPLSPSAAERPGLTVELHGPEGPELHWTRRALRRAGFSEGATGAATSAGGDGAGGAGSHRIRITVSEGRWSMEASDAGVIEVESILELVGRLREIGDSRGDRGGDSGAGDQRTRPQ